MDLVYGLSYAESVPAQVNVHEAKTHFSRLLDRANAGEEIIIAKAGRPVARLMPSGQQEAKKRVPGIDKGKIWMSKDFDVISERDLKDWHGSDDRLK
jgi:prevent-host-death family protein